MNSHNKFNNNHNSFWNVIVLSMIDGLTRWYRASERKRSYNKHRSNQGNNYYERKSD